MTRAMQLELRQQRLKEKLARRVSKDRQSRREELREKQRASELRRMSEEELLTNMDGVKIAIPKPVPFEKVEGLGRQIALVPGGIAEFMKWAKEAASREQAYRPVLEAFFQLTPSQQNAVRLEEICQTLGVSVHDLLGSCVTIASEWHRNAARLIASLEMTSVMRAHISQAKKSKGVKDREMFFLSTGILPTPKGSTFNISANAQAASVTTSGEPSGLPSFEESTITFSEILRNSREAPKALPEPVDAVTVEEE